MPTTFAIARVKSDNTDLEAGTLLARVDRAKGICAHLENGEIGTWVGVKP